MSDSDDDDTRNRNRGNRGQGGGNQQGGQVSIQHFSCGGARNSAQVEFRVLRGKQPFPNALGTLYLGTKDSIYSGFIGDPNDSTRPLAVRTDSNGIGVVTLDFTVFSNDFTRLTLVVNGADPKTVDLPSTETVKTISAPKLKRIRVVPTEEVILSAANSFKLEISTFDANGSTPEGGNFLIQADVPLTVKDTATGNILAQNATFHTDQTPATDDLANGILKGTISRIYTIRGLKAVLTITHLGSRESATKTFRLKTG